MRILIILLFTLNSFAQTMPKYTGIINQPLKPYVFEYFAALRDCGLEFKNQNFIVVFDGDIMRSSLLGVARGMFNKDLVYVQINPRLWQTLTEKQRRHVIFHELSHDIFDVKHNEDLLLMKPYMYSPKESEELDLNAGILQLMNFIKNG